MAQPQQLQQLEPKLPRLGNPKWKDPERRQSIKIDSRVKMEWRINTPLWVMSCWVASYPARPCLTEAMMQIELLVDNRKNDVWDGEPTSRGCAWDRSMHGRSFSDAQPTIIFSSSSKICRRNAKKIIYDERIKVDPRGIGIQYYEHGPELLSGPLDIQAGLRNISCFSLLSNERTVVHNNEAIQNTSNRQTESLKVRDNLFLNGALVNTEFATCTIGGMLAIGKKTFALTVAHAFEQNISSNEEGGDDSGQVGTLKQKRRLAESTSSQSLDLDWALCSIDWNLFTSSNALRLPDGTMLNPRDVAQGDPIDTSVWVNTGLTGVEKGFVMADYSLVALSGSNKFQRMWIVVLDRPVQNGDSGSWVFDSTTGDWLGHLVAGKMGSEVAYMLLAKDIVKEISEQNGGEDVRLHHELDSVVNSAEMIEEPLSSPQSSGSKQLQTPKNSFGIHQSYAGTKSTAGENPAILKDTVPIGPQLINPAARNITGSPARIRARDPELASSIDDRDKEVHVKDYPHGWPRLAAFMQSNDNFIMFRKFEMLHCRELLHLQGEITVLERQRVALDAADAESPHLRYRLRTNFHEEGGDTAHIDLRVKIRSKLLEYDELVLKYSQMKSLRKSPKIDFRDLFNWISLRKPLYKGEDDWIFHADDFVSLSKQAIWPRWFEILEDYASRSPKRVLQWVKAIFQSHRDDSYDRRYNTSHIKVITACLTTVAVGILLIPAILLFKLDLSRSESLALVIVAVVVFSWCIAFFNTNAKSFTATATYCAVLVLFLNNLVPAKNT
ncbi:uncharacterized protein LY89DRAFT_770464 [Mollisia scopiformis]|uniref:DUF6594 domain-containing protein n=1 Tax=Mollisia scopiformis TaxID=149040 RepID=A0A194XLV3_MOLSC|nr:uncharacterized protein LY89DRAFT_770464 [Mollisia scopiformis]KUJ21225.1 hypothetical protein LY89DRAFT_770464 [Mollisia scopiformis]